MSCENCSFWTHKYGDLFAFCLKRFLFLLACQGVSCSGSCIVNVWQLKKKILLKKYDLIIPSLSQLLIIQSFFLPSASLHFPPLPFPLPFPFLLSSLFFLSYFLFFPFLFFPFLSVSPSPHPFPPFFLISFLPFFSSSLPPLPCPFFLFFF